MYNLRDYQHKCIQDVTALIHDKKPSRIMVQSPTGSGKSVIIAKIVEFALAQNKKVLFCVDRKELVKQIHETLMRLKIVAGVIMAGVQPMYGVDVYIASIQTLNRRQPPQADIVIIDEAHGATSDSYRKLWEIYPNANIIGFTATPYRLSGHGFSDLFETLIQTKDIGGLISLGYLVDIKHYACSLPDYKNVKEKNGDYDDDSAIDAMKTAPIIDSYREHCFGKKGIVFAQNVEHSIDIAEQYKQAGIPAKHIDAETPQAEREKAIKDFKEGKIQILTNVALFITGLDVPDIGFVQLLRMTKSLTYYLQMVGRGTRTLKGVIDSLETPEERLQAIELSEKPYCKILDHAGLFYEHGLATQARDWDYYFTRTKKDKKPKQKEEQLFLVEDEEKVKKYVKTLEETKGLRLLEITSEMKHILYFEQLLATSIRLNHKLIASYFKFDEYLQQNKIEWNESMFDYVSKKIGESNKIVLDETKKAKTSFFWLKRNEMFPKKEKEILIQI